MFSPIIECCSNYMILTWEFIVAYSLTYCSVYWREMWSNIHYADFSKYTLYVILFCVVTLSNSYPVLNTPVFLCKACSDLFHICLLEENNYMICLYISLYQIWLFVLNWYIFLVLFNSNLSTNIGNCLQMQ